MTEPKIGPQVLPRRVEVAIVGAGLAGLTAARHLRRAGLDAHLIEPLDQPGGRVRTLEVEGHRLDLGFQVLLTGYPAVAEELDLPALRLHPFEPGAIVVRDGRLYSLPDPFRSPDRWVEAALFPLASLGDKLRTRALRARLRRADPGSLFAQPERMAAAWLREQGFSERYLETFWIPFFSSVFLDPPLEVTSSLFQFVFRSIALGDIALPAEGMGAIPRQILASLPAGSWHPRTRVVSLTIDRGQAGRLIARSIPAGSANGGANLPPPGSDLSPRHTRIERADGVIDEGAAPGSPDPGDGSAVEIHADAILLACGPDEVRRLAPLE